MYAAAFDELVLHPPVRQALRGACAGRRAGRPHPRAGLAPESLQDLRTSRLLLHRWTQVRQHSCLVTPVETRVMRSLLADQTAKHPAHICGRYMDQVRPAARALESLDHPRGAEEIGLSGEIRRIVELNS